MIKFPCPRCDKELRKSLFLIIDSPVDQRSFDKKALRSKHIQIIGISKPRQGGMIYCPHCGWNESHKR